MVKIKNNKDLYRSRLKDSMNAKVLEFLSSLRDDLWIVKEDVIGTEVHNIMLFEQGILNQVEISKILTSLEKIKKKILVNELELDNNFEDIHPLIEKLVIDEIGIEIGGKIHSGRSRNDQVVVDIRMKIRSETNNITSNLLNFLKVLLKVSDQTEDYYIPLYTHLQRGQLGVFSHYINYYISQLVRSIKRLDESYIRINRNPLGACAIGGTSFDINRDRTTELLGFDGLIENSIDAISSKDFIIEVLMDLSLLAVQFSRIAEDFIIWSSKEFNYIEISDSYASVSSVMPQKKNPDTLEITRAKCSQIISKLFEALMISKAIPTGYFRDFQELKNPIRDAFNTLNSIIEIFSGIFSTMKINKDIMIKVSEESLILSLDLAELLASEYKIPFRQAHNVVGSLVNKFKLKEEVFNKTNIEYMVEEIANQKIIISESSLKSIKDLKACLENRKSIGSPSPQQIKSNKSNLKRDIEDLKNNLQIRENSLNNADKLRDNIIKKLTS